MEQQVVSKENLEVSTGVTVDSFGDGGLSSSDLVIPKILVMQGLSVLVTEGKAKFGDLVSNSTQQIVGNIADKPLEFIPFYLNKVWIVSKKEGKKYNFSHIEDVTPMNEDKKWEEVVDGIEWKNEKSYNFYSILPSDPSIPYIVQFKGTSAKAGRRLATQMYIQNKASGLTPAGKVMFLKGTKVSNDKGIYVVLGAEVARKSKDEEVDNCLSWFTTIKAGGTVVVEEDQF